MSYARSTGEAEIVDQWYHVSQVWADVALAQFDEPLARCWTIRGFTFLDRLWDRTRTAGGFFPGTDLAGEAVNTAEQYVDEATTVITAVPVAGQVKGVDGPDWALTCVLMKVTARVVTEDSVVDGMCARMEWTGDRWVIAPGTEPARAPATWPGTQLALEAGWRTWVADEGEPS